VDGASSDAGVRNALGLRTLPRVDEPPLDAPGLWPPLVDKAPQRGVVSGERPTGSQRALVGSPDPCAAPSLGAAGFRAFVGVQFQISGIDDIPELEVACYPAIEGDAMNVMYRDPDKSIYPDAEQSPVSPLPAGYGKPNIQRTPTRAYRVNSAWIVSCAVAAVIFTALTVFMLQNTEATEFSFLWMHGSAPIGLALLIAAAGGLLLAQFGSLARRRRG
jgi:uncharacterized integral membrane protein